MKISATLITDWCGPQACQRGRDYYQTRHVTELKRIGAGAGDYHAVVVGSKRYHVHVNIRDLDEDSLEAECTCPAFEQYFSYCKHIAAVLFAIADQPTNVDLPSEGPAPDPRMAQQILSLFSDGALLRESPMPPSLDDDKQVLQSAYTLHVLSAGIRRALAIELKVGPKRLYVVQKIKEFLDHLENRSPYTFTKLFTFQFTDYRFTPLDWSIMEQLIRVKREEAHYRFALQYPYGQSFSSGQNERLLILSPSVWPALSPLLKSADVQFVIGNQQVTNPVFTDEPVKLASRMSKGASEGYHLRIDGLRSVTLLPDYEMAIGEGRVHTVPREELTRMASLQFTLSRLPDTSVFVSSEQIEPFMERVVPELRRFGSLEIAPEIAEQLVDLPLHIRLYLDREDERLLAHVEYAYGDLRINPLQHSPRKEEKDHILLRDVQREAAFMAVLERSALTYDGRTLSTDDEEAIYAFLHHVLPQLEELSEVFVTPALQLQTDRPAFVPKVRADMNEKTNWLDINFSIDGIDDEQIQDVLRALVEKRRYYRLADGRFLSLETDAFAQMETFLSGLDVRKTQIRGARLEVPAVRGLHLLNADQELRNVKLGKALRQLLDNLKNPDSLDFPVPASLDTVLRDYQKYGFQWFKTLAYYHFGGILADDMGLGKTLQSIAFILSEIESSREAGLPTLIVCPAALTFNWRNELQRFAPSLHVALAVGTRDERESVLDDLEGVDVLITSYPILRRDVDAYAKQSFYALILDEAQAFKNHQTQTAQAVKQIQARQRFALTGTPVENALAELWSIYDVVFPDLFASHKAFLDLSTEQVARRIRPFLLRRMKKEVLTELPDKIETLQTAELTVEQKKLYLAYLSTLQSETREQLQAQGLQRSRMKILAGILRLRQLCCHPALFVEHYEGGSGKLDQFLEIVDECMSGGKRMLVFSQFTEMLGILRTELAQRGLRTFYLDGATPAKMRVQLCDRFNAGEERIFLISLKAGGTGLNLTGADTVVLYDLWWNPAVEEQAADRAHRMGQKNVVQVIRMVTEGTIEEKMYALQQKKRDLIGQVIQPGEEALTALTEQEIRELLMLEET
ncbi:MAG: DEAD/DEAH box helicase [Firmicutes bacterium]|nr:DEAD/DEAH box helicase [Bacillota bacterium]